MKVSSPSLSSPLWGVQLILFPAVSSHKSHQTLRIKRLLAKKQKQNRPLPQWVLMKTGNGMRYSSKRRHWRGAEPGL
ncbi:large ribosomal subunit protein eL39-like [Camelus dromedarius]|uniref:large ribosomal subunit protein eL39-like n=1 Tax=Camelus dromedarius TaxID=9838 RepID=UPI00311978CB